MTKPGHDWPPAHPWRRLLLSALLAVLLHLLMLWLFGPRPGAGHASTIVRPILYTMAPAQPPAATPSPRRPASPRAARPAPPEPAPAPPPPDSTPEPVAENIPPQPPPPPEPAPEPETESPTQASALPLPPAALVAIPGSQRLTYSIFGELRSMRYHANGELLWAHDGEDYEARLEVGAFLLGSRVQSSRGRITADGLQPQRFGDKSRQERVVEFDHAQAQARFSEDGLSAPLLKGAQDQLSIFVQLASQLAANPANFPRGTELALQTVGVKGTDTWHFVVNGEETLSLPGGEQATLKLTRLLRSPEDLHVELWFAPGLGWLPARIRLSQPNGDYIDQQWRGSEKP